MSEYKKCPYCGEEILAEAKKCKYCREWLADKLKQPIIETTPAISQIEQIKSRQEKRQKDWEQKQQEQEQRRKEREQKQKECEAKVLFYKTHELSSFQKQREMYGTIDKDWLLNELKFENGVLDVSTMDGRHLSALVEELKIRFQTDDSSRREVYITHGDKQVHFKEIPGMLSNEDWDALFSFLSGFPNVGETKQEKAKSSMAIVLGIVLSIIVVSLGFFWLKDRIESNPKNYQNEIEDYVRFEVSGMNYIIKEFSGFSNLSSLEQAFVVDLVGLGVLDNMVDDLNGLEGEINKTIQNNTSRSYERALSFVSNSSKNQYRDLAKELMEEYKKTTVVLSDYKKISTSSQTKVYDFMEINTGILFRFSLNEKGYTIECDEESAERYLENRLKL